MPNVDGLIGSDGRAYLDRIATAVEAIADSKNAPKLEDQRNQMFALASESARTLITYGQHLRNVIEGENFTAMEKAQTFRDIAKELQDAGNKLLPPTFDQ